MNLIARIALLAVPLLVSVSTAQAEERNNPQACRADVEKFCKGVKPGSGRIVKCLKQHESEVSSACHENIAAAKAEGKELAEACKPDAQKLCKGVRPGKGRLAQCLTEHRDQLSGACREKIAQSESRHPCRKDMQRLCKGVQPGEGRIMKYMKQHEAELTPECKAHQAREPAHDRK